MSVLEELGFEEGVIVEVVVSTASLDGAPNAAPMGARLRGGLVELRPFKDTATYRNLAATHRAVLNVVDDPEPFVATTLKEGPLPRDMFEGGVVAPRLRGAKAYVEVEAVEEVDEGGRALFRCRPVEVVVRGPVKAYCRARSALIEALIHATRVRALTSMGLRGEVEGLMRLIEHYASLVSRVAPGSRYEELMRRVVEAARRWASWSMG